MMGGKFTDYQRGYSIELRHGNDGTEGYIKEACEFTIHTETTSRRIINQLVIAKDEIYDMKSAYVHHNLDFVKDNNNFQFH